jgi:hypothetical protein
MYCGGNNECITILVVRLMERLLKKVARKCEDNIKSRFKSVRFLWTGYMWLRIGAQRRDFMMTVMNFLDQPNIKCPRKESAILFHIYVYIYDSYYPFENLAENYSHSRNSRISWPRSKWQMQVDNPTNSKVNAVVWPLCMLPNAGGGNANPYVWRPFLSHA